MQRINIILWVIPLFSVLISFSQPVIQWQKSYGSSTQDNCYTIIKTNDGGFIVAGQGGSNDGDITNNHGANGWVVKLNSLGAIQWEKCYGGDTATYSDTPESILQTSDGGYIFAGNTGSTDGECTGNHGGEDLWIVKVNDTGAVQWHHCYGGTGNDIAVNMIKTNDGGYITYGGTNSNDGNVTGLHGSYDLWIVKINSLGGIQWSKCYGTSALDGGGWSIIQTSDDGYAFGMSFGTQDGDCPNNCVGGFGFVKIDSLGVIQWSKCYGGTGGDEVISTIQTLDGGFALTGWTGSNDGDVSGNHGGRDYWVLKINNTGAIQWSKCYGGSAADEPYSIIQNPDGNYVIAGSTMSSDGDVTVNHGYRDYWIIKIDTVGNLIWQKSLGGSGDDVAYSIVRCTDGGYAVAGSSNSNDGNVSGHHGIPNTTNTDYWVVKLAPDTATGINEVKAATFISLSPNPASTTLTLRSQLRITNEELRITDVLGNVVFSQLLNQSTELSIDISKLSNGIYFYEVRSSNETSRGKFVVQH